ncbi:unnamed protein product [Musa hybrid cultivar]
MEQMECDRRQLWPDPMVSLPLLLSFVVATCLLIHGPYLQSSGGSDPSSSDSQLKSCTGCRTTKTPLWRAGPSGPKSLCNACGIRYRKSRRAVPRFEEAGAKEKREVDGGGEAFGVSFKLLMLGSGLCKPTSMDRKQRRRRRRGVLGEEEQAAVLLMALSSGFLYA